ncbi:MAG: hypothetical protein MJ133_07710 [Lachnospiraceae bacterium]|nr:hypothetical protein [Lachnospiraceae bacterium]
MNNTLKRQMSIDLNIFKYEEEMEKEYNQRLIYSGLACWVRTLLYGNSISDYSSDIEKKFPDIMYVQSYLYKVASGFLGLFPTMDGWINDEDKDKASVLAGEIIQEMIYLGEIAEIDGRLLAPVPAKSVAYDKWIHVFGNSTYDRNCISIGLSQWSESKNKEAIKPNRLISISGDDYCEHIRKHFDWSERRIVGQYEIFKVGMKGRYAKSWVPFDKEKCEDGLYLLRDMNTFEPGYFLLKKEAGRELISTLDPWYMDNREEYRIMYALNRSNKTPAEFKMKDMGDYFVLKYPSRLPEYENKLLYSLSWPNLHCDAKFSRVFPAKFKQLVINEIVNLGAVVVS